MKYTFSTFYGIGLVCMDIKLTDTALVCGRLPMEGSLRVENVSFGGNSLGLNAIDGINGRHLSVQIH